MVKNCLKFFYLMGLCVAGEGMAVTPARVANAPLEQRRDPVSLLEREVLAMAESFRGQDDPDGSRQRALEDKISELMRRVPTLSIDARAQRLNGAWEQIWGPCAYEGTSALQLDPSSIYQVIFPEGYAYTVARARMGSANVTSFLRGEFRRAGEESTVRFTRAFYSPASVPSGIGLVDLARLAEAGLITGPDASLGDGRRAQDHEPLRVREIYVDDDLRVSYGGTLGAARQSLYVLRRAENFK
jgi:hypothetical protein